MSVGSNAQASDSGEIELAANVLDLISIQLSGSSLETDATTGSRSLDLGLSPVPSGFFGSNNMNVIVYTNNETGYRLTIKSGSPTNALAHSDYPAITIPAMSSPAIVSSLDGADFPMDSWGYSLDTAPPYLFVPLLNPDSIYPATLIASSDAAIPSGETTAVTFAAKASYATPAGTYSNDVVFTATIDPVSEEVEPAIPIAFYDTETMQEMNSTVCNSVNTPPNTATGWADSAVVYSHDVEDNGKTTLIPRTMMKDTRDGHWYIVSKLADGNCWMTENLALAGGTRLTSDDSNLPNGVIYPLPASEILQDGATTRLKNSWVFFNDRAANVYDGDARTYDYSIHSHATANGYGSYRNTWDSSTHTGHTGAYYSWPAATAGAGGSIAGGSDATQDICPKNWRLPSNGSGGQFFALYYETLLGYAGVQENFDIAFNNGLLALAGNWNTGSLNHSGSFTYWWSRTASTDNSAYNLFEGSGRVEAMGSGSRSLGCFVRCVAK